MNRNAILVLATVFGSFCATLNVTFAQGDLTPSGPPAPIMKSLDQVEPRVIVNAANTPGDATNSFIISAPGSYYLTGNLTGASSKHGISVQADDVTLDLNGFEIISGGGAASRGVTVPAAQTGFCIRNGTVRGWTDGGVRADGATTLAEKLRLTSNTGAAGLVVGNGSMIKDCVATANGTGFVAPDRTHVNNCISTVNTGDGFDCTSYVTLIDCTSSRNGGIGIVTLGSSSVIRCNASRNANNYGIQTGAGCTVDDCTAGSNGFDGIYVSTGSVVRNCTAQANVSRGISANNGGCQIVGNTCVANDTGIIVQGSPSGDKNRVDSNSCSLNTSSGFVINGFRNLVVRNNASGNGSSSYSIPAGNAPGPIVDMTAGGTITSTSPWANFVH